MPAAKPPNMVRLRFDWLFLRRFADVFIYINKDTSNYVILLFLLLMSLLEECITYNVGMITASYYKILGDKNLTGFYLQTAKAFGLIVAIALTKSSCEYVANSLYLEWRQSLARRLHSLYFVDTVYYHTNVIDGDQIDNPDQRITQDVDKMTNRLSQVMPKIITFPFVLAFYGYRSYSTVGWIGPVGCFGFFLVAAVVNKVLMSPVVDAVYQQEMREGSFRYQHVRVRDNAESIALLSGGGFEWDESNDRLNKLIKTQQKVIVRRWFLGFSVNFFDYAGSLVSFVVLAVPLFAGVYDHLSPTSLSQLISQNAFVSIYLINVFTRMIDTSDAFAEIAGTTHRIGQLIEFLTAKRKQLFQESVAVSTDVNMSGSRDLFGEDAFGGRFNDNLPPPQQGQPFMRLIGVNIKVPSTNKLLLSDLNLTLIRGQNLLISGPSGSCKSSIVRVLKALWVPSEGVVDRVFGTNDPATVMFLPQKALLTSGSLLEQITYPNRIRSLKYQTDDFIKSLFDSITGFLSLVGLEHLLSRVDGILSKEVDWNWCDRLSPGEIQRLSFVRLFYHRPQLAVLDEATSAMPVDIEEKVYEECRRLDITLVSCGHRESLVNYHQAFLKIELDETQRIPKWSHYVI